MGVKSLNSKILFGLKVRQLRLDQGLSFAELAKTSGISVSYLNEIEKGKKFPKPNKIVDLSKALSVTSESLTSNELPLALAPIADLLQSNFLNELPLELFGIDLIKVVEIIANSPIRVGAFISTLVDISRNYALREDHFYFAALRSYQELHYNYFEDLEQAVLDFSKENGLDENETITVPQVEHILKKKYKYNIVENGLKDYPEFNNMRSVFIPRKKQLLLSGSINSAQLQFQYGKEVGFNYLGLKDRSMTSSLISVKSFDMVLTHARAAYFSVALFMNKISFTEDLSNFFNRKKWDGQAFMELMNNYNAAPEMFFQRLTNVIPQHFGIKDLFLLRILHNPKEDTFKIDKELHMLRKHHPHSNGLREHYCRRWMSISLLQDLNKMQANGKYTGTIVGVQKSSYYGTDDEYLCFTLARSANPHSKYNVSVTLGMVINDELRSKIKFVDDPSIKLKTVSTTCERCDVRDCKERKVPPIVLERIEKRKAMTGRLKEFRGS